MDIIYIVLRYLHTNCLVKTCVANVFASGNAIKLLTFSEKQKKKLIVIEFFTDPIHGNFKIFLKTFLSLSMQNILQQSLKDTENAYCNT